jgi:ubiquinone/menaquinone biosynthesis C-methylase UbiE
MKKLSNLEFKKKFDSIAKIYEKISSSYTINRRSESFNVDSSELILEAGSGTGVVSELIDNSIICTDISYEMCKQAVSKKRENVICCDAEKLPIRNDVLDGILSTEMIYYLNNPQDFLKNSYDTLKNNAKLMITVFNQDMKLADNIRSFLRIFDKNQYFDDGQKDFINTNHLKEILEKNNFKITSVKKKVIFPFKSLHKLNLCLEKTRLNYFCYFVIIEAKCIK